MAKYIKIIYLLVFLSGVNSNCLKVMNRSRWLFKVSIVGIENKFDFVISAGRRRSVRLKESIVNPSIILQLLYEPYYAFKFNYPWQGGLPICLYDNDGIEISKDATPIIIDRKTGRRFEGVINIHTGVDPLNYQ